MLEVKCKITCMAKSTLIYLWFAAFLFLGHISFKILCNCSLILSGQIYMRNAGKITLSLTVNLQAILHVLVRPVNLRQL